ncbi:MAG: hypothetical protein ACD_48C00635G0003, partial [uncultured bacterium]
MEFQSQTPLPLLPYRKEERYRRMSMGVVVRNTLLFWGISLSRGDIAFRRIRIWLERFEILGSLLFGVGFLGLFVWAVSVQGSTSSEILSFDFWWGSPALNTLLVWFSLTAWCFLLYRSIARKKEIQVVEPYDTHVLPQAEGMVGTVGTWEQALSSYKGKKKKDIARDVTPEAFRVIEDAVILAHKLGAESVSPWHVFHALLGSSSIASVFVRLGLPQKKMQALIATKCEKGTTKQSSVGISDDVQQILFYAYEYAYESKQEYVHVTELLLSLVRQSVPIQELFYDLKVDAHKLLNVIEWLRIRERLQKQHRAFQKAASRRSKYGLDKAMTAVATPFLNSFSHDLTLAAKFGRLEPCVAREKEIDEIFRIIEG